MSTTDGHLPVASPTDLSSDVQLSLYDEVPYLVHACPPLTAREAEIYLRAVGHVRVGLWRPALGPRAAEGQPPEHVSSS